MSSQRGNANRTRPQKHKNKSVFKNDLHDKSKQIRFLNTLQVTDVCVRCKSIIEWKIKYKKYKVLKAPKTCIKCNNKSVKNSYHTICSNCATNLKVCCKCGSSDFTSTTTLQPNVEDDSSSEASEKSLNINSAE